ncbi:AAA family ATPase, putative [Cordyceps militaris CM01]|uniref:AAA family ATPase, putative n=2 Tax=Cordyceps militaris TaxID=73501 RepID=G3JGW1_CORMM|nr:AAA family ATPase, putative [Cordyceps militaris CM01]ATY59287.1 AAA family [Cordyceps militaris]EGX91517.1 AAA family ATPase, putative [Cordyceps militaris CM01]
MEQQGNSARSVEDTKAAETTPLPPQTNTSPPPPPETEPVNQVNETPVDKVEKKAKNSDQRKQKEAKTRRKDTKSRRRASHQESDTSDDDDTSSDESDLSDNSAAERKSKRNPRRRRLRKVSSGKLAKSSRATSRRYKRRSRGDSDSALSSDSSSDSERDCEVRVVRDDRHSGSETDKEVQNLRRQLQQLQQQVALQPAMVSPFAPNPALYPMQSFNPFGFHPFMPAPAAQPHNPGPGPSTTSPPPPPPPQQSTPPPPRIRRAYQRGIPVEIEEEKKDRSRARKDGKPSFRRVDFVWDSAALCFKIRDTTDAQSQDDDDDDNIFLVRRTFDTQGRYRQTFVDIRSKLLRECLKETIGEVKGVTFVEEIPKLDPDFLFLYLDDLRAHYKHLKTVKPTGDSKRERAKNAKKIDLKTMHLKILLKYLRKDYADIKRQVDSLLRNGLITFELLWALWKPKSLVYTTSFGDDDEPRVFRVESVERHVNMQKGEFYHIDGKYFEYDGKHFGYGSMSEEIGSFRGARKITSLPCYPLRFHRDEAGLRARLVARGKRFVELRGVHFKSYSGMAYLKSKKHGVIRFNVQQSRMMVDTKTFRRINPNYSVSPLGHTAHGSMPPGSMSDDDDDSDYNSGGSDAYNSDNGQLEVLTTVYKDGGNEQTAVAAKGSSSDSCGKATPSSSSVDGKGKPSDSAVDDLPRALTDEDYILASPVVLGFAFAEKQWLEFKVSNVREIKWNDQAWDSLVLPPETKDLIKALVTSRRTNASRTIDDVIQGKGKGLVTVLHGAPGTGKTLTAEGISELLQCPLYMVSAGELGTDSRYLEAELQRILDICHAWGAVLLLDEADVFLEKRNMSDVHRNALVSIFLRQLEYFQGILFLTTNRVETFDEAFQSRIHIALRYDNLDAKAKRKIFGMFLDRVRALGTLSVDALSEEDLARLVRQDLNGREIKNVVSSAQDLAMSKGETLGMKHLLQVLDVHARFSRDLKGGTGYEDAMRSYF